MSSNPPASLTSVLSTSGSSTSEPSTSSASNSGPSTPSPSVPSSPRLPDFYMDFILEQRPLVAQYEHTLDDYNRIHRRDLPKILTKLNRDQDQEAVQVMHLWQTFREKLEDLSEKTHAYKEAFNAYELNLRVPEPGKTEPTLREIVQEDEGILKACDGELKREMAPLLRFLLKKELLTGPEMPGPRKECSGSKGLNPKVPKNLKVPSKRKVAPSSVDKVKLAVFGTILVTLCIILGWAIFCIVGPKNGTTGGNVEPVNNTKVLEMSYGTTEPSSNGREDSSPFGSGDPSFGPYDLSYDGQDEDQSSLEKTQN